MLRLSEMFRSENTEGYSDADLDLMNAALQRRLDRSGSTTDSETRHDDVGHAHDHIHDNWQPSGNTVDSLDD